MILDEEYPYLHAARAELLRRSGRHAEAVEAYRRALVHTVNDAERRFLDGRLDSLASGDRPDTSRPGPRGRPEDESDRAC